jgi:adenosylhomocysteine nucleosidase
MNALIRPALLAAMVLASAPTSQPATAPADQPTLILGALKYEIAPIEKELADKQTQKVRGIKFITGSLAGRPVVLARTGYSKVNAAMVAALAVERFSPREVIFSGISGGISGRVGLGDVVIAEKTAQHDCGIVTDKGFEPDRVKDKATGEKTLVFYPADPVLLEAAQLAAEQVTLPPIQTPQGPRQPVILTGVVVTGDLFIASPAKKAELLATFGADAVEMEGAAVAAVCRRFKVPCLVIRSISDLADEQAEATMKEMGKVAAENAAALTMELVKRLPARNATASSAPATVSSRP